MHLRAGLDSGDNLSASAFSCRLMPFLSAYEASGSANGAPLLKWPGALPVMVWCYANLRDGVEWHRCLDPAQRAWAHAWTALAVGGLPCGWRASVAHPAGSVRARILWTWWNRRFMQPRNRQGWLRCLDLPGGGVPARASWPSLGLPHAAGQASWLWGYRLGGLNGVSGPR